MRTTTPQRNKGGRETVLFEEIPNDELCFCGHPRHSHKGTSISTGNPIDYQDGRDLWEKRCANHRCTEPGCSCKYFCLPFKAERAER